LIFRNFILIRYGNEYVRKRFTYSTCEFIIMFNEELVIILVIIFQLKFETIYVHIMTTSSQICDFLLTVV